MKNKNSNFYKIVNTSIVNKNLPAIEPCPLCGSSAKVWKYSMDFKDQPVSKVVMCSNAEILNTECALFLPSLNFYKPRIIDAIEFWNAYAKAVTKQRIKRISEKMRNHANR